MKSSTQDQAEGMFHKAKGKIKEITGKVVMNPELEAEGKDEKVAGKVQEKIGQVRRFWEVVLCHFENAGQSRARSGDRAIT